MPKKIDGNKPINKPIFRQPFEKSPQEENKIIAIWSGLVKRKRNVPQLNPAGSSNKKKEEKDTRKDKISNSPLIIVATIRILFTV